MTAFYGQNGVVKIELCPEETDRYGLNFRQCEEYISKRSMISVFTNLLSAANIRLAKRSYKVSLYYGKNNESTVTFSPSTPSKTAFCVSATDEKQLLDMTEQLYLSGCHKQCLSSLYLLDDSYYYIIVPITRGGLAEVICSEYSDTVSKDTRFAKELQQNGKLICSVDAIRKLGKALCRDIKDF